MKINLAQTFKDLDDNLMKDGDKPVTARHVIRVATTAELPEDSQGSSQEALERKMKNYDLYQKVSTCVDSEIELTPEEVVHIKQRISKIFGVLIVGPMVKLLA